MDSDKLPINKCVMCQEETPNLYYCDKCIDYAEELLKEYYNTYPELKEIISNYRAKQSPKSN